MGASSSSKVSASKGIISLSSTSILQSTLLRSASIVSSFSIGETNISVDWSSNDASFVSSFIALFMSKLLVEPTLLSNKISITSSSLLLSDGIVSSTKLVNKESSNSNISSPTFLDFLQNCSFSASSSLISLAIIFWIASTSFFIFFISALPGRIVSFSAFPSKILPSITISPVAWNLSSLTCTPSINLPSSSGPIQLRAKTSPTLYLTMSCSLLICFFSWASSPPLHSIWSLHREQGSLYMLLPWLSVIDWLL